MTPNELDKYHEFYKRNTGYVSEALQEKIRTTRILIAGCGVGGPVAEACVRLGFVNFILADSDTVEVHNLNRQSYVYDDIGKLKVDGLARRLKAINPNISVTTYPEGVTEGNVREMVAQSDFVFDTVDFLELVSIVALHDEVHAQKKPLVSGTTAGWGAMAIYFPPSDAPFSEFRRLFDLPLSEEVKNESYVEHYKHLIGRFSEELEPVVVEVMAKALTVMEDGKPCPASQVSVGSASLAALATTLLARVLNNEKVTTTPHLVVANISAATTGKGVSLER